MYVCACVHVFAQLLNYVYHSLEKVHIKNNLSENFCGVKLSQFHSICEIFFLTVDGHTCIHACYSYNSVHVT